MVLIVAGATVFVLGVLSLGSSLTPYPRPRPAAVFREGGPFRHVRNPVYGGVILLMPGWSVAEAPPGLPPPAALVVFFALNARREEALLGGRCPEAAAYVSP